MGGNESFFVQGRGVGGCLEGGSARNTENGEVNIQKCGGTGSCCIKIPACRDRILAKIRKTVKIADRRCF